MKAYPLVEELLARVLQVAMPRAVGSPAYVARYAPRRRGRPKSGAMPSQNQEVTL